MGLKAVLENLDDLDSSLHEHYKKDEKSGSYVLDLDGAEALPVVKGLKDENAKFRIKARDAENKLKPFAALGDPAKLQEQLDRIPELEAAAEGKIDEGKIGTIVEGRLKAKLAPVERERDQYKARATELETEVGVFKKADVTRKVVGAVSKAARELKVVDTALEDVEMYGDRLFEVDDAGNVVTKENAGVVPGLSPKQWLEDMQGKRPHWFGPSAGGGASGNRSGANGGSGPNPWSHEHWNMTEQGKIFQSDRAKAEKLAAQAGTKVGGARPAPKK